MKRLLAIALIFTTLTTAGCAALAAVLPDIVAALVDGGQILATIESFMASYFANHPDPVAQAKVADAILKARTALNLATRAAQGTNDANDKKLDQAFADFEAAYVELLKLVAPYGVKPARPGGNLSAAPGELVVPEPLSFRTMHKGR